MCADVSEKDQDTDNKDVPAPKCAEAGIHRNQTTKEQPNSGGRCLRVGREVVTTHVITAAFWLTANPVTSDTRRYPKRRHGKDRGDDGAKDTDPNRRRRASKEQGLAEDAGKEPTEGNAGRARVDVRRGGDPPHAQQRRQGEGDERDDLGTSQGPLSHRQKQEVQEEQGTARNRSIQSTEDAGQ